MVEKKSGLIKIDFLSMAFEYNHQQHPDIEWFC